MTSDIPPVTARRELGCDVLVIGGGTAGTMAALTAARHGANVLLLEKAHVRHSGALAMGMDGVNNAVVPGKATPEEYVADITVANDGIVNQRTVFQTATRGFDMVRRLEGYGVKFEKDEHGEYAVRKVHRSGSYVLPMPEGRDVKKVLYRTLRARDVRAKVTITNRVMPVRVLTVDGVAVGAVGFDTRTGEFVTVSAGAVILAAGACGRLGLPASGYLYGTYENPTNAGDGYAMAYHAGAELSGIECFQINPLIKDYNGPACAYVANPFGGYQVNAEGNRFVDCDYWSGRMMAEVKRELDSARGPIYLKLSHLPDATISEIEGILHTTERPTRGTFHAGRGTDYRTRDIEMHISEIGLCSGHSASGVWVDEYAATTVPGLYAAGDMALVPHNYMIGAFVYGDIAGEHAAGFARGATRPEPPSDQIAAAHELIYRPLGNPDGPPQQQVEYKLRRFVNDYLQPPKAQRYLTLGVEAFERMRGEIDRMGGRSPHELMRCAEVTFIRDCAEMAARASLRRTESRWGLYHQRADWPESDDAEWFCHLNLFRNDDGEMTFRTRPIAPYIVPVPGFVRPDGVPDEPAPTVTGFGWDPGAQVEAAAAGSAR
ncbi:fumarate reductase/succinate dehydrogenase flavoprotein subunit [Nocardia nova]|jgi:succinate dehydrogenase/fumarate reductase flavoprotein subunit|uniref:fumarate reductase/succinate dehydrogenase flavoprotein subunit n=1 Tax=Nocardia nova TaxID=37330 RepID=UPI003F6A442C